MASPPDTSKNPKLERYNSYIRRVNSTKLLAASSKLLFRVTLLVALVLILFFTLNYPPISDQITNKDNHHHHHIHTTQNFLSSAFYGSGAAWEKQVRHSSTPRRLNGFSVLVTGAAGFVGTHCSLALKKRGDGVLGLDNFNSYYDPSLKRARQQLLKKHEIFIVEGDLNDAELLAKLFDIVPFTHVLHLAAQAGVRYAMENPQSYVGSNIAGFVSLLEVAKAAVPQPSIVWASSSSVYGLNTQNPFSESHRCVGALDTAAKSTGTGGKKRAPAQLRVYNLGNTAPVPVEKLVGILESLLGVKAKKHVIKMPRNGDVPFTHANVSLAYRDFGYKPTTDLATGLRKFVKWYVSYYGIESRVKKEIDSKTANNE
ncbi:hypothetical protein C3L33_17377, partial [Rhododendron williamsianum]